MQPEKAGLFQRLMERMRRDKKTEWAVYGSAIALALLLYILGGSCGLEKREPDAAPAAAVTADTLEQRLTEVLSTIRGAGSVCVMVTYETTGEIVPAMASTRDTHTQQGGDASSSQVREVTEPYAVATDGGETPVVLKEVEPAVRGVIVVAEGAADPTVRMALQRAVQAVTGVSAKCVEVFEMKGQE